MGPSPVSPCRMSPPKFWTVSSVRRGANLVVTPIGPEIEVAADKFRALIDPDRLRIAHCVADPFEGRDNVFGPIAEPRINRGREPAERVHDGEDADLLTGGQLNMDEVHGPDLVRSGS